jgi:hypothetical protein
MRRPAAILMLKPKTIVGATYFPSAAGLPGQDP